MPCLSSTLIIPGEFKLSPSERQRARKTHEELDLGYFLGAYSWATDETLQVCHSCERPDFVCERSDCSLVGIELVKVIRDPETAWAHEALFHRDYMEAGDALYRISYEVDRKEQKRQQTGWLHAENTIVVVQLMDCPIADLEWGLAPENFSLHGFAEIWLADFTCVAAYGCVDLFGIHPASLWGYYDPAKGQAVRLRERTAWPFPDPSILLARSAKIMCLALYRPELEGNLGGQ